MVGTQMQAQLTERWYGPYTLLQVRGVTVRLQLPAELGNMFDVVNVRRLLFVETQRTGA